jgi:iron complex outermembrane receptor protein
LTDSCGSVRIAAVAISLSALTVAVLFVVFAAAPAGAQEAQPLARLPELRVIAPPLETTPLPRSWVPGRVEILTDAEIQTLRPSVLPQALERLPGVTLQDEQGTPFQPTLTLRGFSASSVTGLPQGLSVFLDGVRINEPTVEEVNFDLIPLEDAERVEVIRGPSVLFGRNTLGGAVSIITRRGEEIREIVPELAGGSFGRQQYRLRAGGEARPFDYYVSLNQVMEDGYRDFTSARLSRAFVKIGVQAADTDATISYQFSNNRIDEAGSLPQSVLRKDRRANLTAGDFWSPELNFGIVNVRRVLGEHWTVSANAFVRALDAQQFNVNLITEDTRLRNRTLSVGGAIEATHRGTIVERDNVLIVGAEYTRHDVHSRTFEGNSSAPALTANLTDTQDAVGVFGQDSLMLARDVLLKGSTLVVTLAGRWDGLRHDIDDQLGGPSGGVFWFNRFVPRAGVNFNLTERLGFYASYAEGFRAPAFLELTCAGAGAVCPGLQVGVAPDPPLQPVKTTTYEVGTRARLFPWLDADVSGYWTDVRDDIFSVSPSGTTGVFFQNVGRTRRQGVEVGLRGRLGNLLEGYLNYAFTRATFQDRAELATPLPPGLETVRPGDSLALVPRHRINLGAAYHPWSWATLSVDVKYVSAQFLRGDEVNRQPALPGYWVAGLGASVKAKRLEVFVRLNNALNNRYETFGTFAVNGLAPGQPVERFLTPAPPINVLAGLQYSF